MTGTMEMSMAKTSDKSNFDADALRKHLEVLKLAFMLENHQSLAQVLAVL